MKKKRFFALIMACVLAFGMLAACGKEENSNDDATIPDVNINIGAMKGPTALGMLQMMENGGDGHYQFEIAGSADVLTPMLIKGDLQIAAVPCNLAAVLYQKTKGEIQVAAINTLSVLYIVETGDTIQSVEDLRGKTICLTGAGTTPEYTLRYLLAQAGLKPDEDVFLEFKSEASEVAALLAAGEADIAMLPQPFVTSAMVQNENLRIALDVEKEWEKYAGAEHSIVTGVVVVNKKFAEENPKAVEAFLANYKASAEFTNASVADAAALAEKHDIIKAAMAQKAIPYCNITFLSGDAMKEKISAYLSVLYDQNPSAVGGAMPADDFYYGAE